MGLTSDDQTNASYQQQWQDHLAHEITEQLALKQRHQQEKAQFYLQEINVEDRTRLTIRHEAECKALLQQHRATRIARRKHQPRQPSIEPYTGSQL